MAPNPYTKLPARAYWRTGIARHSGKGTILPDLWSPSVKLSETDKFLTVGSCFAQHIGKAMDALGLNRLIVEKAPMLSPTRQAQFGYGIFSFRLGNVYTSSMLLQWLRWMQDPDAQDREIWRDNNTFFDPARPSVEPGGFETEDDLFSARAATLAALRRGLKEAEVMIFTLGLTETWYNSRTGLVYASCPGAQAGEFDARIHTFRNATFNEVSAELAEICEILRSNNPKMRLILTVSPVPLTATAVSGAHVLVSTVHSKSVLRAAAGEFATTSDHVDYFPSYEIVSHPALGMPMFQEDHREVTHEAVSFVMKHFLAGIGIDAEGASIDEGHPTDISVAGDLDASLAEGDVICDDFALDSYNEN